MTSTAWATALIATLHACGSGDTAPGGSTGTNGATATSGSAASGAGGAQASASNGTPSATSGTTSTMSGPATGPATGSGPATGPATGSGPATSSTASGGGCLKCSQFAMMANADPNMLCASSKPLFDNFVNCVCVTKCMTQCGQACQQKGMFPPLCQQCAGMNCMAEIQACQADK